MTKTLGYGLLVLCCLAWLLILVIPWMEFSKGETAGIFVCFEASSFQEKSRVTEGKVVYVPGSSYRIQYVTDDGTEKIKQGSGKNHGFREVATARVWYSIDNPDRARLTDGKRGGEKIIAGGAFCILMGIYPLFLKKKVTNQKPAS